MEFEGSFPASFTIGSDISHAVISDDGSQVVAAYADKILIVDIASQKTTSTVQASGNINDLVLGKDGTILAPTNRDLIFVHTKTGNKDVKLPEEGSAIATHEGFAFVGTKRGNFLKVELSSGSVKQTVPISGSKITKVTVGSTGAVIGIGSSNGLLSIYSTADGVLKNNDMKYHNLPITAIEFFANDTRCLTGAHERDVHLWDLEKLAHLDGFERRVC